MERIIENFPSFDLEILRISEMTSKATALSKPEVGSSRSKILGEAINSVAIPTRFFCPPLSPRYEFMVKGMTINN